jgi:hypothetical protein
MLVFNSFFESLREVHGILAESAKNLTVNSFKFIKSESLTSYANKSTTHPKPPSNGKIEDIRYQQLSGLNDIDINHTVTTLRKDGFCRGINLNKEITQQIWQFAMNMPCYANSDTKLSFCYSEKNQVQEKHVNHFVNAHYDKIALLCPVIKKIETDPILLKIASQYWDAEPLHQESQLWWNFPRESTIYERRRAAQLFHSNEGDSRSLRFSFYITDVDLCSSPHVCVRGSHVKKKYSPLYRRKGCSYQDITSFYGYKNIVPICGKAGSGFVEDTRCFHQATSPGSKDRLILQVTFSHHSKMTKKSVSQ